MMKKNIIFKSVAVLCALACILSIGQVMRINNEYKQGEKEYSNLADLLVSPINTNIYVTENAPADDSAERAPIDVNFDLLREMNVNAVGWLYCPGTVINYPVLQSSDNSYYLNHLFDNQTNSSGAIFMDAMNSPDLSNINTIIYGHNMKNGSMFASLQNYSEQWYYEKHPVMYYITKDHSYKIDIFASYETAGNSDTFTAFFDSEATYSNYIQKRWNLSQIDTSGLPMTTADNILTLSTCSYDFDDARYVVQGKVTQLN